VLWQFPHGADASSDWETVVLGGHRKFVAVLAVLSPLLGAAGMAVGADLSPGPAVYESDVRTPQRPWTLSFTPYSWLAGLDGHTAASRSTATSSMHRSV
jgi:hypothetical protein